MLFCGGLPLPASLRRRRSHQRRRPLRPTRSRAAEAPILDIGRIEDINKVIRLPNRATLHFKQEQLGSP